LDKTHRPPDRNRKAGQKAAKPSPRPASQKERHKAPPGGKQQRDPQAGPSSRQPSPGAARPAAASASMPQPAFRRPSAELSVLYGIHAVRAAIAAKRRKILSVFATAPVAQRLAADLAEAGLTPQIVGNEDLARRLGQNAVHQGIMIEARPLEPIDLSDIVPASGIVLALDQITDPHNVGAIMRTAAAFGVDAVVTTERHSPELSGVMAKAASGGLDHVPIALVGNFARALERLGDMGYLRVGLDSEAPIAFEAAPLSSPLVLVLGGEGKGLRRLSREKCDLLVRLDMPGPIKSLNVSNACAVALTLVRLKLARP
jgi:23S rRNA (guanosine2251-2'-O)-methyltransferase